MAETLDAPKPRSTSAIRQARYRARAKGDEADESVTGDVTRDADSDVTTVTEASLSLLPNENKSNPTTHTHEKQTPRASKGTRLPAEWMPKPLTEPLASAVAGWPPGTLDRELERLRDWAASATGPNAKKSDWDAAWRNWIRKIEDEGRYENASNRNSSGSPQARRNNVEQFTPAQRRLAELRAAEARGCPTAADEHDVSPPGSYGELPLARARAVSRG